VWKKILFVSFAFLITFSFGFGTGYFYYTQSYTESRERTERELGQLRGAVTDAQVRSDTAIRGLDEAIRGLSAIQDRNKRIAYLIDSIGATVKQLREIYDTTSRALQTDGTAEKPVENNSNR